MHKKIQIISVLAPIFGILLVPLTIGTSRAAEEDASLDAYTCAGVYFSITNLASDANYRAMEHQYYLASPLGVDEAADSASKAGTNLTKALREGRISASTIMDGAKMCSKKFDIPLPVISRVDFPDYAAPEPTTSFSTYAPVASAPLTPAESPACIDANNRYVSILRSMPGRLEAAGPSETNECDDQGRQCGIWHRNSKFYYTLGEICTSLKPAQEDIRRSCGEVVQDLDKC